MTQVAFHHPLDALFIRKRHQLSEVTMTTPRLFVSYSWSNPEHEQWVVDLATSLVESGIDVVLDKWDLKEGQDSVAFMEKMVTDPTITKVLIVSDGVYSAKADGRSGGVGTETQIISREVYERTDQRKFVAVLPCKDGNGKPFLPTYFKGRIYIDLSEPGRYADEFERLLRWVFDKPLFVKPELGSRPRFLAEEAEVSLGTTALFRQANDAVRLEKSHQAALVDEYFEKFAENLEKFRIAEAPGVKFDEIVVKNLEGFLPYSAEYVQLLTTIAKFGAPEVLVERVHRFFERLLVYTDRPEGAGSWHAWQFDNFRFIVHELFVYTTTVLLRWQQFDALSVLLARPYYQPRNADYGREVVESFGGFRTYVESFQARSQRLQRLSSFADLIKARSEALGFDFKQIMQAELVLFLRSEHDERGGHSWRPHSLVFAGHSYSPFEIFARAISDQYFRKIAPVLGVTTPDDFRALVSEISADQYRALRWQFERVNLLAVTGAQSIGTKP